MSQKIAIIEDDKAISQMYRIKFEAAGFQVVAAANGQVGLELVKNERPDIILLDLMMPEMDGHEMLSQLRATDWGKNMKVVILTNIGESEIAQATEGLSISGLIIKAQMTPSQVVDKVRETLTQTP